MDDGEIPIPAAAWGRATGWTRTTRTTPFTDFEHEVALRSWLMLPPIPDLPEEPCVCGETTPGQMHAMRCKVVRRALTTGRHNALQHELIGACRAAGLRVETEPVLSVTTQSTKRGHHGTNYNPLRRVGGGPGSAIVTHVGRRGRAEAAREDEGE